MPGIIVESGTRRGERIRLREEQAVTVGRDTRCTVQIPDPLMSRVHCVFRMREGRWYVQDNKSLNLLFVNNTAVRSAVLSSGDVVQLGDTKLSFVEEDEDPLAGRTLSGYRIQSRLGSGTMGTVYRALQISIDRDVALKLLAPRLANDSAFVQQFLEEARAAGRLNHPHVVQVYDAGKAEEHYYISMEYLEGGTLEDLLVKEGKLPLARAVSMILDAAAGLAFAEELGIVHRDIKPANLLLTGEPRVKLGDLGLATDQRKIRAGNQLQVVGSPAYMAPEQTRKGAVDHRADIYALGGTLYRMISGSPPFVAASITELLSKKLREDPIPLHRRRSEIPQRLSAVVQKMLARKPSERFASAVEVREALEPFARQTSAAAPQPPRHAPRPRPRHPVHRKVRRKNPSSNVVLAAAIPVGLLIAALVLMRSPDNTGGDAAEATPVAGAPATPESPPPDRATPPPWVRSPRPPQQEPKEDPEQAARRLAEEKARALEEAKARAEAQARAREEALAAKAEKEARAREQELARLRQAVAAAAAPARSAVARFDFDAADAIIDKAAGTTEDGKKEAASLRREVRLARAAWQCIEKPVADAVKKRTAIRWDFEPAPAGIEAPSAASLRVLEMDGAEILTAPRTTRKGALWRSVFSLTNESLRKLASASLQTPAAGAENDEGLAILLLLRKGPARARSLLAQAPPAGKPDARLAAALEQAGSVWLSNGLQELRQRFEKASAPEAETGPEIWNFLAGRAAQLLAGWIGQGGSGDTLAELRKLYTDARVQALRLLPPAAFFHARQVKFLKDEIVRLRYDFSEREQLEDFNAVKGITTALGWLQSGKLLKISGEVRFLRGNPFVESISVTATVPRGGCDAQAPNINTAFWTQEDDSVTPLLDGKNIDPRKWLDSKAEVNDDYVVFGMGYLIQLANRNAGARGWRGLMQGVRSFLPLFLRQPSYVIFGGNRGASLHKNQREAIWQGAAGDFAKGGVRYTVSMAPGTLQWRVNNRRVPFEESLEIDRVTKKTPEPGSVTFFTNGHVVHYSALEVTAKLDPAWVDSECRARAKAELAAWEKSIQPPGA